MSTSNNQLKVFGTNDMINLFARLFKKEPVFNYTIAEYQPIKVDRMRLDVNVTEHETNQSEELSEMELDDIYTGI